MRLMSTLQALEIRSAFDVYLLSYSVTAGLLNDIRMHITNIIYDKNLSSPIFFSFKDDITVCNIS